MPIIGVTNPADGDDFDKQAFIEQMSTPIPHVLANAGEVWVEYGVVSQPTMIFVAADGSTEAHTGGLGPQGLLERVEALAEA
ncbi:MAG: TlpA family protein disulfide reductase [Acidimicrobiales bacterium]